ncbi:DNA-processing protein DprA [candidate division WOR-3 bacterium]|nr:DNA-processing protein DprA [candidate division WOR-3 bacterium]
MSQEIKIANLIKLSNLKTKALRLKKILKDNKDILNEEDFINQIRKKRDISHKEATDLKGMDIEKQLRVLNDKDISILTFEDTLYPKNLLDLEDAPPILYCKGKLLPGDCNAVAIIGTRKATEYGKTVARNMARKLSCRGVVIVSGMARGIDTQAHIGALESRGRTIAVMGTGIDQIYPPGNKNLAPKIMENGALLTELPPFSSPLPYHFPERNRIISGLSKAVIAIQAPLRSGVFSTVKWALEYGRDVYALPGDVTRKVSEGTNRLLKMGAIPITDYRDVIRNTELDILEKEQIQPQINDLTEDEKRVYLLLEQNPKTADTLAYEAKMKPQHLLGVMALLEIKGFAREVGGKRFIKNDL